VTWTKYIITYGRDDNINAVPRTKLDRVFLHYSKYTYQVRIILNDRYRSYTTGISHSGTRFQWRVQGRKVKGYIIPPYDR